MQSSIEKEESDSEGETVQLSLKSGRPKQGLTGGNPKAVFVKHGTVRKTKAGGDPNEKVGDV